MFKFTARGMREITNVGFYFTPAEFLFLLRELRERRLAVKVEWSEAAAKYAEMDPGLRSAIMKTAERKLNQLQGIINKFAEGGEEANGPSKICVDGEWFDQETGKRTGKGPKKKTRGKGRAN